MLQIAYRDELGYNIENVETETVEFFEGYAWYNDKKIPMQDVIRVGEKETE